MNKNILTVLTVSGMLSFTAQAQTTPASTAPAGNHRVGTTAKPGGSTGKTGQDNSSDTAPNRSSTAGTANAETSNNPVDATGKPVSATQSNSTSTVKSQKPKK